MPIPGFDLGNSPGDFTPRGLRGQDAGDDHDQRHPRDPGQSGGRARLHRQLYEPAGDIDEISVQFLKKDHATSVHIVCAGTEGHISLEDSLLAGALTSQIANLADLGTESEGAVLFGNDEALMVVTQWLEVERFLEKRPLWKLLSLGAAGRMCSDRAGCRYRGRRPFRPVQPGRRAADRDPLRIVAV